jgi:hypothetical protein
LPEEEAGHRNRRFFYHLFFRDERFVDKTLLEMFAAELYTSNCFHTSNEMPHLETMTPFCEIYVAHEKKSPRKESKDLPVLNDIPFKYTNKSSLKRNLYGKV